MISRFTSLPLTACIERLPLDIKYYITALLNNA